MTVQSVLLPAFVLIALTFVLGIWMGRERIGAIQRGEVKMKDLAGNWNSWPHKPTLITAAYHNQFQLPVLLYVLVLIAIITTKADLLFVVLSWVFVLARLVHAWVHTRGNDLQARFRVFMLGAVVLLVMWIWVALKLFLPL